MPSSTNGREVSPPKPSPVLPAAVGSPADHVQELFHLLSSYCSGDGFQSLRNIHHENETLKLKNQSLEITNKENRQGIVTQEIEWIQTRADLQKALKDAQTQRDAEIKRREVAEESLAKQLETNGILQRTINGQREEIGNLTTTIAAKDTELSEYRSTNVKQANDIKSKVELNADLKAQLAEANWDKKMTSSELVKVSASLNDIKGFAIERGRLKQEKSQIQSALGDLLKQAVKLFKSALNDDLKLEVFARGGSKDQWIPLPASNSDVAKQMRVAVALRRCSDALAKHIFRPTFITKNYEIDHVLYDLAAEDPGHEAHLRGVLLKAKQDEQGENMEEGINQAVNEIVKAVGQWVSNTESFKPEVRSLCERAFKAWGLILQVEERIIPDFKFDMPADWNPMPTFEPSSSSTSSLTSSNNNSQAKEQGQKGQKQQQQQNKAAQQQKNRESLSRSTVAGVIWPMFLAAELHDEPNQPHDAASQGHLMLVQRGIVLTKAQVQQADDELAKEETFHKTARESFRRSDSGAQKPRRNSFLVSRKDASDSDGK